MKIKGIHLAWITVKNIDAAVKFYTDKVGLTVKEYDPNFKWAELSGPDGTLLGIGEESPDFNIKAGNNAIVCITVDDMNSALDVYAKKGVKLVGEMMEIPGHVKIQTCVDTDNNTFQIVERL